MPELPEVETTKNGISPFVIDQKVSEVIVRQPKLRWPIPDSIQELVGETVLSVERRSKYLFLHTAKGCVIIHLGMSGSLRILDLDEEAEKHDHFDIVFENEKCLRLRDPRRFGCVLWCKEDVSQHKLIKNLGPEPLSESFNYQYLLSKSAGRKVAIKQFIMNANIVVGVGNIYASESLFLASLNPKMAAGVLTKLQAKELCFSIKEILKKAIESGGTTLNDFRQADGKPGYFAQELAVYGRNGAPCLVCGKEIRQIKQAGRATYYCAFCQE